jgi:hypothetical protein
VTQDDMSWPVAHRLHDFPFDAGPGRLRPATGSTERELETQGAGAQVIPLLICIFASLGLLGALYLPWYGFSTPDQIPRYSAVSPYLVPPVSSSAFAPGTQKWGYLILAVAVLIAGLAVTSLIACLKSQSHLSGGPSRLLLCLAIRPWPWWHSSS